MSPQDLTLFARCIVRADGAANGVSGCSANFLITAFKADTETPPVCNNDCNSAVPSFRRLAIVCGCYTLWH